MFYFYIQFKYLALFEYKNYTTSSCLVDSIYVLAYCMLLRNGKFCAPILNHMNDKLDVIIMQMEAINQHMEAMDQQMEMLEQRIGTLEQQFSVVEAHDSKSYT